MCGRLSLIDKIYMFVCASITGVQWETCTACCFSADSRGNVRVPVHEAIHSRGDVSAPSGLLPAAPQ